MNMKTAIEWLMDEIKAIDKETYATLINEGKFDEAKGIEQEYIENAYWDGGQDVPTNGDRCKEYYNKQYK